MEQVNVAQVVRQVEALEAHSLDTWYEVMGQVYGGSAGECAQSFDYDLAVPNGSVFEALAAERLASLGQVAAAKLERLSGPQVSMAFACAGANVAAALEHLQAAYRHLQNSTDSSVSGGAQVELQRLQRKLRNMEVYLDGMAEE